MPRPRRAVMSTLRRKGLSEAEGDHTYYIYFTLDGRKTVAKTKVSHSGKDISDPVLGMMARQCKLAGPKFYDLVDCPLSRESYEQILKDQGFA
ncbi:MAG: hypothetical protein IJL17_22250 [Kiritimatiellae bacterium]|nr:hypothetical protein [Kiritimatiellia bacterium]